MDLTDSPDFEKLALDWLFHEIERLVRVMGDAGISDTTTQREICEKFFFAFSANLDGAEVAGGSSPRPKVTFHEGGRWLSAEPTFSFHEYSLGVVGEAFGDS